MDWSSVTTTMMFGLVLPLALVVDRIPLAGVMASPTVISAVAMATTPTDRMTRFPLI
jgi:hypothetical protein